MQRIEKNVWQPYQQIPCILSTQKSKISKLIDTLQTPKQARALIFLGTIQQNNKMDDNALQTFSKVEKLYLQQTITNRQQILPFLVTASAKQIFIYFRKKQYPTCEAILDSILDKIGTIKQYEQLCFLLFKVKSIVDLGLYDRKNSVEYKFSEKIQYQFWKVLETIGQCNKTSKSNMINESKIKKKQPIDVIIFKMKQKQLYLIQLANMSIISEVTYNYLIPNYATKALHLALKQQIQPFQSAIKAIANKIQNEQNSLILYELSKTPFFKKAIENYKIKVSSIVIIIDTLKRNLVLNCFYSIKKKAKKPKTDQQLGMKEWNICKDGQYIIKCNYNNAEKAQKYLWIHDKSIRWANSQKAKARGDYTEYKFKYIRGLVYGKVTDKLCSKQHQSLEPWKCFSLICVDRTIDFYCNQQEKDLLLWLTGITYHLHHYFDKKISIYSKGRTIWKMINLKSKLQNKINQQKNTDKSSKALKIKKNFKLEFAIVKRTLQWKKNQQKVKSNIFDIK